MAINYVAPSAPRVVNYGGGGGGRGGDAGGAGDLIRQQAVNQGNQLDYMRLLQAGAAQGVTGKDVFAAESRMAMIQEEAQAQAWVAGQKMTMHDRQEMTQIQAGVSEVQRKVNEGLYTQSQGKELIADLYSRGRVLQQKENVTKMEAMKAVNDKNDAETELITKRAKRFGDTAQDRVTFILDQTQHARLADEVRSLQPGLEGANPAEFEQAVRQRGEDQGAGRHFYQPDVGKLQPMDSDKSKAAAGSATGGKAAAAPKPFNPVASLKASQAAAEAEGLEKDTPEFKKRVGEIYNEEKAAHEGVAAAHAASTPEGKAAAAKQIVEQSVAKHQTMAETLQARNDIPPQRKQVGLHFLGMMDAFVKKHGIPAEGTDLRKKLDKMADDYKKAIDAKIDYSGAKTPADLLALARGEPLPSAATTTAPAPAHAPDTSEGMRRGE